MCSKADTISACSIQWLIRFQDWHHIQTTKKQNSDDVIQPCCEYKVTGSKQTHKAQSMYYQEDMSVTVNCDSSITWYYSGKCKSYSKAHLSQNCCSFNRRYLNTAKN